MDEHKGVVGSGHRLDLEKLQREVKVKFIASLNGENYRTSHAPVFQGKNTNVRFVRNKATSNRFEIKNLLPVGDGQSERKSCMHLCTDANKDPKANSYVPNEVNLSKVAGIADPNILMKSPNELNQLRQEEMREFPSSGGPEPKRIPLVRSFSNKFASNGSIPELSVMVKAVSDGIILQANPQSNDMKEKMLMASMEMDQSDPGDQSREEMREKDLPDLKEKQFFNILKDNYEFLKSSKDFQNDEESFEIEIKRHSLFKPVDARKEAQTKKKPVIHNPVLADMEVVGKENPVAIVDKTFGSEIKGNIKIGTAPTTLNSMPKLIKGTDNRTAGANNKPSLNIGITSIQNLVAPINEEEIAEGSFNGSIGKRDSVKSILKSNTESRKGVQIKSRFKVSFKC